MKHMKRILCLALVAVMLFTLSPAMAKAEYAETIDDYQTLIKNLDVLEGYALDYSLENSGKDPVALVLNFIRSGSEEYNNSFWNSLAGGEDSKFASYVFSREEDYNAAAAAGEKVNVSGLRNLGNLQLPNGDILDMPHLFATMDVYCKNVEDESNADAASWAGNIVDLMVLVAGEGISGSLDEMVQQISENYFTQDKGNGSFDRSEYLADLDSYAISHGLAKGEYTQGLTAAIESYFTSELKDEQRGDYFLKNRMDAVTSRGDIRNMVFNAYVANAAVASLEGNANFSGSDLAELRRACCYAYADYICSLAGDYVQWNENVYYTVNSSEKITLSPGITHEKLIATTADDKQVVYYLATADVSNPYVNVYMNYRNNDPTQGWGLQSVRDQAHAAEVRHSDPESESYIANYNVIVAVNGAGYNMTTGEPAGLLMMDGVEYHAPDGKDHGGYGFFGILKDGSAIIGSTEEYYALKEQGLLSEGIDNFGQTLVKDGELAIDYAASHVNARHSRTAVGITRTGKVVFMVMDGRQEPVSCGGSFQEIAQVMLDAGCVDAINLDGGGSTTYLSQKPGDSDISLTNNPSDNFERPVSASMLMVSTLPDPTLLERVEIDSDYDYLTVGAKVQMNASGLNAAGEQIELPEDAVWTVSGGNVATVSADGVVTGLKKGTVEVSLKVGGKLMGSKTLLVVEPTEVYFEKDTMGVVRGEKITLPVAARYEGKPIAIRANDITIKLSNSAGSISGLEFTAGANSTAKSVVASVSFGSGSAVSDTMTIMLYNKGEASFNFDEASGGGRRLAWLRNVTNSSTGDGLTYSVVDSEKPMVSEYALAFDAAEFPLDTRTVEGIFAGLGIIRNKDEGFLLQLADKLSGCEGSTVTLKIAFDSELDVDISNPAISSDIFSIDSAKVESGNVLSLVLRWKEQSAPLKSENTNTVSILTGISAKPKDGASWDAQKRLFLGNGIAMEFALYIEGEELFDYAQANPGKGIEAFEDEHGKCGLVAGAFSAGKDDYTLVNSAKQGWVYEKGGYAYYEDGEKLYGVQKAGDYYYDFGEDGVNPAQTKYSGMFQIDGVNHYAKDGSLVGGIYEIDGEKYHFDENGKAVHGEKTIEEVKVIFDNGVISGGHNGFITKSDGNVYHYDNGRKTIGWVYIGEDLYHFNTDTGIMTKGTHVLPDAEARAKGAYYDFDENGKTLWAYFNGFGYYYWAGAPLRNGWVKEGSNLDRDAWYRTNTNGHYVTSGGTATFKLTLDGVTYDAVKIECDGVVYTFNDKNGMLLKGDFVLNNGKWYYYWAGNPLNSGWFDMDGNTYYAYPDGHLATGSNTIGGETYMFTPQGVLVKEGMRLTASFTRNDETMNIKIVEAGEQTELRIAVWSESLGQEETLTWLDMENTSGDTWETSVALRTFKACKADTYQLHVYSPEGFLIGTTAFTTKGAGHIYSNRSDTTCEDCGERKNVVLDRDTTNMFRMYNPNTGEHFYTGSEVEKANLVAVGWQYEGVGFTFPTATGAPVYRLFDPATGEHLYTMDEAEKAMLEAKGWNFEGIAFNSAYDTEAVQHRLYNPNATVGAYHFTFSEVEKQNLIDAGWRYQGIGWYSCWK